MQNAKATATGSDTICVWTKKNNNFLTFLLSCGEQYRIIVYWAF